VNYQTRRVLSGFCQRVFYTDILLVRMTSDTVKPVDQRYNYSNAIDGLIRMIREEGPKTLARGLGTNVVSFVLSAFCFWFFLAGTHFASRLVQS
jgi:hypothetical protein